MKILCVIDHFGSGGAQRQMVELARSLHTRGHNIETFIYFPQFNFFRSDIDELGINVHEYNKKKGFSVGTLKALVEVQREGKYDVVISFLDIPSTYAELASLFLRGVPLIVSERSSYLAKKSWSSVTLKCILHFLSSSVVTNSFAQAEWYRKKFWLRKRVVTIYNGIDLHKFDYKRNIPQLARDIRLIAVGRVGPEKNVLNLIEALAHFSKLHGFVPKLTWVGKRDSRPSGVAYCAKVDELLDRLPHVSDRWDWLGERSDVPEILANHHALIHPSFYEGLPNVVCEAMASGRPVLASSVCDHPLLVKDGERGFLFDPVDPLSISDAIYKLATLSHTEWVNFSQNARDYAKVNLGTERMVDEYERLLLQLC